MPARTLAVALCLATLSTPGSARETVDAAARAWVADVVERVQAAASPAAASPGTGKARTVDVHVRVAGDGTVLEVGFGPAELPASCEDRLRTAVGTAGPLRPPPRELLTPDGSTELSFPLRLSDLPR